MMIKHLSYLKQECTIFFKLNTVTIHTDIKYKSHLLFVSFLLLLKHLYLTRTKSILKERFSKHIMCDAKSIVLQKQCNLVSLTPHGTTSLLRPGCVEGWKTLTAANWRNMLNLIQLSPEAQADDVILCGETLFQSCCGLGGGGVGGVVEQASRPYKAKGMPGWIRIRGR